MRKNKISREERNKETGSPFCNEDLFDCKKRAEALKEWEKIFLVEEVWGASILPDFNQK